MFEGFVFDRVLNSTCQIVVHSSILGGAHSYILRKTREPEDLFPDHSRSTFSAV